MKTQTPSAIGIDIAKDKFDTVHLPSNEHTVFENNKEGIKRFINRARKRKPTTIVCEATGGYQNEFVRQLIKANLPTLPASSITSQALVPRQRPIKTTQDTSPSMLSKDSRSLQKIEAKHIASSRNVWQRGDNSSMK